MGSEEFLVGERVVRMRLIRLMCCVMHLEGKKEMK